MIEENERLHQYEAFRYDYLQLVEKYMNTVEDLQKVREENKELNKLSKKQEKELKVLDRRYKSLSNSKLGRLTLWYWSFKKRRIRWVNDECFNKINQLISLREKSLKI